MGKTTRIFSVCYISDNKLQNNFIKILFLSSILMLLFTNSIILTTLDKPRLSHKQQESARHPKMEFPHGN
jgi:hypothetical protein